ncbi:MAG: hypothetical protein PVJ75_10955 [Chloroflexota bacterium]|jgi:hypothetical protein
MSEERIEAGKAPVLQITCPGDLKVKGWSEPAILVKGADYTATETEKALNLELLGEAVVLVPVATTLTIVEVAGDLAIRNVDGPVVVSAASGDVNLRSLASVDVGVIRGDLAVRHLNGSLVAGEIMGDASLRSLTELTVEHIYGDLAARNIDGPVHVASIAGDTGLGAVGGDVTLLKVHGDASLRNISGLCQLPETMGDIRLRGGLTTGKHQFSANGNIIIRWPEEAPLMVEATAAAFDIRLPLEDMVEQDGALSGHIGDGETLLRMEAKGRIIMKAMDTFAEPWGDRPEEEIDWEFDLDLTGLGQHITSQINDRLGEWSSRLDSGLDAEVSADIERRVRDAAARAEKAAERAMRQAEKAAKKARWQAQRNWSPPAPPRPTAPKESRATEEEQLKILRMVESGVITPEEAETLLKALENG